MLVEGSCSPGRRFPGMRARGIEPGGHLSGFERHPGKPLRPTLSSPPAPEALPGDELVLWRRGEVKTSYGVDLSDGLDGPLREVTHGRSDDSRAPIEGPRCLVVALGIV